VGVRSIPHTLPRLNCVDKRNRSEESRMARERIAVGGRSNSRDIQFTLSWLGNRLVTLLVREMNFTGASLSSSLRVAALRRTTCTSAAVLSW
jgi:hypothetical protein